MTVQDVWNWLDGFAPFATQEGFDNAGLVIGAPGAQVHRVLFALDATLPVVQEAAQWGAQLLVTHHPLLFGGVRAIRVDEPEGAVIAALAGQRISLIAAHTNLDRAPGGTGDALAAVLGLADACPTQGDPYLRTGTLATPQTASAFHQALNAALGACARRYGVADAPVQRVTVGAGAIGGEYPLAAADGAQAYVVGEIKHHELIGAQALGLIVYEAGHSATELPGIAALYQRFATEALAHHWPVEARLTAIPPYACALA